MLWSGFLRAIPNARSVTRRPPGAWRGAFWATAREQRGWASMAADCAEFRARVSRGSNKHHATRWTSMWFSKIRRAKSTWEHREGFIGSTGIHWRRERECRIGDGWIYGVWPKANGGKSTWG